MLWLNNGGNNMSVIDTGFTYKGQKVRINNLSKDRIGIEIGDFYILNINSDGLLCKNKYLGKQLGLQLDNNNRSIIEEK